MSERDLLSSNGTPLEHFQDRPTVVPSFDATPGDSVPVRNASPGFVAEYDRILVQRDPEEANFTGSKLVRAQTFREKTATGKIISGGPAALDLIASQGTRVGDRIAWARYAGTLGADSTVNVVVPIPYKTTEVCGLMVKDILFNYSKEARLATGEQEMVLGSDNKHFYRDNKTVGDRADAAARYAEVQAFLFPPTEEKKE